MFVRTGLPAKFVPNIVVDGQQLKSCLSTLVAPAFVRTGQAHKRHYPQHLGGNSYCSGTADDEGSEEGSAMHAKFVGIVEAVARRIRAPKLLVRDYAKLNSDI
eukprot:1159351-Pelagomonas_calceolata.AAC.1